MASQSGTFTATFDVTPSTASLDSAVGLSAAPATAWSMLAAIVRFNPSGTIDARNGGAYAAAQAVPYAAGATYRVRMVVNVAAHTYSAFVTPPGKAELTLAQNYAFRTEQASVSSLASWAVAQVAASGKLAVCVVAVP
jgi:hypothetical protein